ncbi:MAG: disulfide oxidoreductase [Vicinamibacteria bacterium]|nr:disulfide oxidoreductase [Vicinamibacteria bacterium]
MTVTAVLGPTNTGKTHAAMERLLSHRSGMIGFPLRLLARENYERAVRVKGADAVALVTGEERVVPRAPAYFICTVEAMPVDRPVDFLAVDEIQLAADRERGHVFTDRLINARGRHETMLLGASTIRPLLRRLVPEAAIEARPRLSTLCGVSPKRLARLPRRSAVIVFSVAELYELAARMRRETGGAALVFGALSPRTRNAQVGLYQSGEVDYIVATDAIGMGLNLDIDHVAFTSLTKHDGSSARRLRPAEVAQIAGRAGRHLRDGTFGATSDLGPLDEDLIRAVETHDFAPLRSVFWRNGELSFVTIPALLRSLDRRPPLPEMVRMRNADDHQALRLLAGESEIRARVRAIEQVRLLWDVCQVPDFRNVLSDAHARLLQEIFLHLSASRRRLPEDWVAGQVAALDRIDGDVGALLMRIAAIRTWTYVSHRAGWLSDPRHWQERSRRVEDRLSDTLHERLTEQFVDRRATVVARSESEGPHTTIGASGEVEIQGMPAGRLEGFHFVPEAGLRQSARPVLAAVNRVLREGSRARVQLFVDEPDDACALSPEGRISWRGASLARLAGSDDPLAPRIEVLSSNLLDPPERERVRRRCAEWLMRRIENVLRPLMTLRAAPLSGPARGIAFSLVQGLGALQRRSIASQIRSLEAGDRARLARHGVRIGRWNVFLPALLRPEARRLTGLLWRLRQRYEPPLLPLERAIIARDRRVPEDYYLACGYAPLGSTAWRLDHIERVTGLIYGRARRGQIALTPELGRIAGAEERDVVALIEALGFHRTANGVFARSPHGGRRVSRQRGVDVPSKPRS